MRLQFCLFSFSNFEGQFYNTKTSAWNYLCASYYWWNRNQADFLVCQNIFGKQREITLILPVFIIVTCKFISTLIWVQFQNPCRPMQLCLYVCNSTTQKPQDRPLLDMARSLYIIYIFIDTVYGIFDLHLIPRKQEWSPH